MLPAEIPVPMASVPHASSALQRFDLAAVPPTPWKNGGGHTRTLACWPPGADMDNFDWRVSVASVAASGPFSVFVGVERQIMLLDGAGVHLRAQDRSLDVRLDRRWQPLAFAGEAAVDGILLDGAVTDFNLMLRRGRWEGEMAVVRDMCVLGSVPAGLCMVLSGHWRWGKALLTIGQGLWWSAASPGPALVPQQGGKPPALVWVGLKHV